MARDTHVDSGQMQLVPGRFARHILPGRVAYALSDLIDHALERSAFEARFPHDHGGAPADAPAGLRTIGLLASSQGLVSSRAMEAACRELVWCMAMAGDSQPPVTTLAARARRRIDASIPGAGYRKHDGVGCARRPQGLRHPPRSTVRQVAICLERAPGRPESPTERRRRRIDRERRRERMGRRFATSAPVCGNLQHHTRRNRFTRRGRGKVDGPWERCCLGHNLEPWAPHGEVR
jgi:Transposase DDE domain